MLQWFRDRLRNSRPWFRADSGTNYLEGTKHSDGKLEVSITRMGQKSTLMLDRETADKLSIWFGRMYPSRGSNVISITKSPLSVLPNAGRPEGSSGDT